MTVADHLKVTRQHGLFFHHGIDLGDGTVAHYLEGREILRSTLQEFSRGRTYSIINHADPSPVDITLRRALSRIGETNYNLLFNNCEHFAYWCKTGKHHSEQMENLFSTAKLGTITIKKLIPTAINNAYSRLLKEGIINKQTIKRVKILLLKVSTLRQNLDSKLEEILERINHLVETQKDNKQKKHEERYLLKEGKAIANQLSMLEDIEFQIEAMINQSNIKQ